MTDRKRAVRFLLYAAEILILFLLQEIPGLLPPIMGARPMLILAAVLTVAMVEEPAPALFFGVGAGLLADLAGSAALGYHALVWGVLCFLLCCLCGTRIQIQLFTAMLMGLWSTAVVLLDWLVLYVAPGYSLPVYALTEAYLPLYFYTFLMIPVCYGLQRLVFRISGGR